MLQDLESINAILLQVRSTRVHHFEVGEVDSLPNGTSINASMDEHAASLAKDAMEVAQARRELTWKIVVSRQFFFLAAQGDPLKLRSALIHLMALCLRWVEDIDKKFQTNKSEVSPH